MPGSVFSSIQIRTWAFKFVISSFNLACILRMCICHVCFNLLKQTVRNNVRLYCRWYVLIDVLPNSCIYRISRPNSRVFHSNSFPLHSNSTILVQWRISAVQMNYSSFQIYGFIIRINIFFIQIYWNSTIFTILSFNLALYGLVTFVMS